MTGGTTWWTNFNSGWCAHSNSAICNLSYVQLILHSIAVPAKKCNSIMICYAILGQPGSQQPARAVQEVDWQQILSQEMVVQQVVELEDWLTFRWRQCTNTWGVANDIWTSAYRWNIMLHRGKVLGCVGSSECLLLKQMWTADCWPNETLRIFATYRWCIGSVTRSSFRKANKRVQKQNTVQTLLTKL